MRASAVIERVLRDHPETRSSDKELYIRMFEYYGLFLNDRQKAKFRELPFVLESIRRTRQKFQEAGKYEATEKVKDFRKYKSMEVQQRIPITKPSDIQRILEVTEGRPGSPIRLL